MRGLKGINLRTRSQRRRDDEFDTIHEEEYEIEIWYVSVAWQGAEKREEDQQQQQQQAGREKGSNFFKRNFGRSTSASDPVVLASAQVGV